MLMLLRFPLLSDNLLMVSLLRFIFSALSIYCWSFMAFVGKRAMPTHVYKQWPLFFRFLFSCIKFNILDDDLMPFYFRNEVGVFL